ncbi:hypothetical protein OS493_039804, partial [Desmophyllum pertusum]
NAGPAAQDLVKGEVFYDKQKKPNIISGLRNQPKYDGGSAVSHYIVEHKTVNDRMEHRTSKSTVNKDRVFISSGNIENLHSPAREAVNSMPKDEKTLARSNKSRSSTTYCGSLGVTSSHVGNVAAALA